MAQREVPAAGARFEVTAGGDGYAFVVDDAGRLRQAAFGPAIERPEVLPFPPALYPLALPTYGEEPLRDPALRVTHADGTTSTRLVVDGHDVADAPGGTEHRLRLVDPGRPLDVVLGFRTYDERRVLEQWLAVTNRQDGPIVVHEAAAAAPTLAGGAAWLTHYGGGWAAEWTTTTERLTPGTKVIDSKGGVRPHLHRSPFFLLAPAGPVEEESGTVLAGALAWGGNVRFAFELAMHQQLRALCGHHPLGTDIVLDPGETFTTPRMQWAWSTTGLGPLSRRLHHHVREEVVRDGAGARAVVANNWEATFFDFDHAKLSSLIDDAADLGAELFLLDDGWFGSRHPRDDDTAGLGDWEVDRRKLPDGLAPLVAQALDRGLRFGLWIEPEMVNRRSQLYADHPGWVVSQPGRDRREERQQLVLDLCRPDVADFVVGTVDRLLAEHPGITYLKWDANREVSEPGSSALAADRQGRYWVDSVHATWAVMDRVMARHPTVELMLCASGGGRVDLGTLRRFHEVWTSDNTDPIDRVRMQWSASQHLPVQVLGAHVTRWGGRPLGFACAVAMSARFGFDLDTTALAPADRATVRRAAEAYRRIRDLVQHGDLHRLVSPLATERAALAFVAADARRAVVFAYQLAEEAEGASDGRPLRVRGLDPSLTYAATPVDLGSPAVVAATVAAAPASGAALADTGLRWPLTDGATAAIWELHAVDPTDPGLPA